MKRFHVHVNVNDLDANIPLYSTLFGSTPAVRKPDYAQWMLEDPQGVRWETFHTHGEATTYSEPSKQTESGSSDSCRDPQSSCCGSKTRAA